MGFARWEGRATRYTSTASRVEAPSGRQCDEKPTASLAGARHSGRMDRKATAWVRVENLAAASTALPG